jgi:hypothetical protein
MNWWNAPSYFMTAERMAATAEAIRAGASFAS